MKNLFYLALLLSAFIVISCNQDPCKDVVCGDEGTCLEGTCDCNTGWEKDSAGLCNTAWADKFVGTNVASEDVCTAGSVNAGTFTYNTTVTKTNATTLSTTNLFGYGATNTINIDVTSSADVSINDTDVAGRVFTGTGTKVGNVLTIDAIVTFPNNGGADTCVTTLTY